MEDENQEAREELLNGGYSAFSDLATKSLNCQARSAAIFVGLHKAKFLDRLGSPDSFLDLFRVCENGRTPIDATAYDGVPLLENRREARYQMLYPLVPCRYTKEDIEEYYNKHYSHLSNKKT